MPEIKHVFTQGKMNKDLDERLVENGQYRDAMNIQVSTSEGSDVGVVQNILGNVNVFPDNKIHSKSVCVGAIADEKNNCFYWFVYHNEKNLILKFDGRYVTFVFVDTENVLKFSNNLVTGINIIDDFLFWTDNKSEPKKINVTRSINGTDQTGDYHTCLIVPKRNITKDDGIKVREEHITVIKKSPKTKLVLDPIFEKNIKSTTNFDFTSVTVGSLAQIYFNNLPIFINGYKVNDILVVKENDGSVIVRMKVTQVLILSDGLYEVEFLSLSSDAITSGAIYDVEKEDISDLFERKFIRFGYRYKYEDGEYSSFSPFTDVVFKPDLFEYSSKDAYNKAMENNLISLKLRNFITAETPEDVTQVDILYKESDSPTVYIVDKLKYKDPTQATTGGFEKNYINANLYEITSDLIFTIVSSNQLLRAWDNVPRKALAQEVTGNRIVYGNYTQNYDVEEKPILQANYVRRFSKIGRYENVNFINDYFENQTEIVSPTQEIIENLYGQKSLKSLRNYQLGLTYLDEYNRETPIFTSSESIFNIPKKYADHKLRITGQVRTLPPDWATSFKVYIKETSTEYYNLAMSRVYNAEDGNVWLAFPSAERNKVDEETFLILKKSVDTDNLVEEEAKYKVLAIENEAPQYITQETVSIAEINCGGSTNSTNVFGIYSPVVNSKDFRIVENTWSNNATESLHTITEDLVVYFKNTLTNEYTKTYDIKSVSLDNAYYKITLDKVFETQDAELIYPNYPTTTSGGVLDLSDNLEIIISKKTTIEESSQFKGMFFVKINNDRIVEDNVLVTQNLGEYEIVNTMPTHYFADNYAMTSFSGGNTDAYNGSNTNFTFNYRNLLDFGGTSNPLFPDDQDLTLTTDFGGFFIDKSWYAATQPGGGLSPSSYQDTGNNSHVWQSVRDLVEAWRNETNTAIGSPASSSGYSIFPSAADITAVFNNDEKRWYFYNFIWDWFKETRMQDSITPGSNINVSVHPFLNGTSSLFPNNPPIRWFNPDTGNYDTLPSIITYKANPAFGKGIYTGPGGDHFVEVSFSAITPDLNTGPKINSGLQYGSFNTSGAFDIRTALQPQLDYAINYSTTDDKLADIANNMKVGKRFKIRSDDDINNIYTITKVQRIKRYSGIPFLEVVRNYYGYVTNQPGSTNSFIDQATFENSWDNFGDPINRRYTFRLRIENENGNGLEDVQINSKSITHADNSGPEKSVSFQFLEPKYNTTTKQKISDNPAIWETEPKETADLDIYYEASEIIPLELNEKNNQSFIPLGSVVTCPSRPNSLFGLTHVVSWDDNKVTFNSPLDLNEYLPPGESLVRLYFTRPDNSYTTLAIDVDATLATSPTGLMSDSSLPLNTYIVKTNVSKNPFALSWFNCFSFGNGVESNRIRDDFNQPIIDKGVKVSTILEENYEEEKRSSGLIYSGIYNTNSGINNLNQFIQAEKITKDLNPTYGSIQKLFSRNTDLIAFCEDRVIKILANKDAVFNADGNPNLVATENVLGQSVPFVGDYGISQNPESFAADNYRAYFTDKQRGAVLRLSMDGLTPISEYGMSDYFKDNLKFNGRLIGSFDIKKNEYNLTMPNTDKTVSFKESVNGWSSFKSFVPEQALSMNGDYYTLKNSLPYQHHLETYGRNNIPVDRNTFYSKYTPSSVSVLLNDMPNVIKMYKTLGYEGSQSNVDANTDGVETGYYNLENKDGWKSKIKTDKQEGVVSEFIEKEGKWFNYIKGINFDEVIDLRTKEFSFQGIGRPTSFKIDSGKPVDSDPPPPPPPPSPFSLPSFSFTYGPPLTNLQGQQNPNIIGNISWQGQTWALMSFTLDVQPALNIPSGSSGVEYEITELYYINTYGNQVSLNYIPSGGLMTPPYNLVGSGPNYIFQNYNNSNTLSPLVSLFTTPELITSSVQVGIPFNIDGAIFLNPPTGITGTNWPIDITCTVTATDSSGVVASHTEVLSITV